MVLKILVCLGECGIFYFFSVHLYVTKNPQYIFLFINRIMPALEKALRNHLVYGNYFSSFVKTLKNTKLMSLYIQ